MCRSKKHGGMACFRSHLTRRHLFFNARKNLVLDEILEYENFRCVGKWWEVVRCEISEDKFRLDRKTICKTECYAVAWDLVKDVDHEMRKTR